jgi:hypothetical protein
MAKKEKETKNNTHTPQYIITFSLQNDQHTNHCFKCSDLSEAEDLIIHLLSSEQEENALIKDSVEIYQTTGKSGKIGTLSTE